MRNNLTFAYSIAYREGEDSCCETVTTRKRWETSKAVLGGKGRGRDTIQLCRDRWVVSFREENNMLDDNEYLYIKRKAGENLSSALLYLHYYNNTTDCIQYMTSVLRWSSSAMCSEHCTWLTSMPSSATDMIPQRALWTVFLHILLLSLRCGGACMWGGVLLRAKYRIRSFVLFFPGVRPQNLK